MPDTQLVIKSKKMKGDDGYRTFSIRVNEELVVQIDQIAAQTGRSRNELIGMFLKFAVENCQIEE